MFRLLLFILIPNILYAATSVTVDSITWNFDSDYTIGQFANGDSDPFGYTVPGEESGSRAITDFQEEMWDEYRDDYPIATGEGITGIGITLK